MRTWARGGLVARAVRAVTLPWRAAGRVLLVLDPDVLLGAVPVAALRRRRVVADVHEDYAALLRDRPWARGPVGALARALVAAATRAAGRVHLTVVADEHVPPHASAARRRLVVPNTPSLLHVRASVDGVVDEGADEGAEGPTEVRRGRSTSVTCGPHAVCATWSRRSLPRPPGSWT